MQKFLINLLSKSFSHNFLTRQTQYKIKQEEKEHPITTNITNQWKNVVVKEYMQKKKKN